MRYSIDNSRTVFGLLSQWEKRLYVAELAFGGKTTAPQERIVINKAMCGIVQKLIRSTSVCVAYDL